MRSLFSRHGRHPTTPPPPSFSGGGGGGGETPPQRRTPKENVDPSSYTSPAHHHGPDPFRSPSSSARPLSARNRLPPRPPSSNPLKRKLDVSSAAAAAAGPAHDAAAPAPDSGVQVVVRIRPPCRVDEEEVGEDGRGPEACIRKSAVNSVAIQGQVQGQDFTFDAVADAVSTQEDIFNLVGRPLVENCLSGFNSSIFAYGQIYNEQITDLLEPTQRNLQIREDVRTSCVYVESLTKQNLINILAEISQSGKQRHHVPYRDSKLTFLLQESLGGNAKLAMICAVSPSQSCKNETLSTLRFAQRAKAIKNNAVVNEEKVEDVNALREQIRQLKDELHRMKSNGGLGNSGSITTGWNPRRSLHLLKMSLGRPTTFQAIKEDSDEEMEIDENDVEKPCNNDNMTISPIKGKESKGLKASIDTSAGTSHVEALDGDKNLISTKRSCCDAKKFSSVIDVAASIQKGLQVIESHQNNSAWRRASVGLNARIMDIQPCKVDVAIQTDPEESEPKDNPLALIPSCLLEASANESRDPSTCRDLQLVPVDGAAPSDDQKQQHFVKAVEKVLAGAIRREMARDEQCAKQAAEIQQLNRLILQKKYENHPDVLRAEIEVKRLQEELDMLRNSGDEKEVLQEEIQDLKNQLHYMLSSSSSIRRLWPPVPFSQGANCGAGTKDNDGDANVADTPDWTEAESKWITLTEELRVELEATKSLVGKLQSELESEKKCSEELKEAVQSAIQGAARHLEQYADLQETHFRLLALQRRMREGIDDVNMRAEKAGIKGPGLQLISSLAAELSFLKAQNEGLQGQLRDTAEAVQAAGELLVRLKDAEEAEALAKKRALMAEQETEKAYQEIDNLKKNYDQEIVALNQRLAESSQSQCKDGAVEPEEPIDLEPPRYDTAGSPSGEPWKEEFSTLKQGGSFEVSKSTDLNSWFYGYDKCNI
ncbi:hypothetical protein HU200_001344 [Digitaria exilis]|uniref:Kinesin motor domain-containing protein n=1 Tax=Digitaria exilis TaxID=1010633 RepID=A0A835G1G9_9POAL|nr:hypothetical protein HU200_001344 [Digitaria exilis]